jgi:hypothetical protein
VTGLESEFIHSGWRIAPAISPPLILIAKTTPIGICIDLKKKKFKDTGVAFCTERMPIALAPIASKKLMASKGIVFIIRVIKLDIDDNFMKQRLINHIVSGRLTVIPVGAGSPTIPANN